MNKVAGLLLDIFERLFYREIPYFAGITFEANSSTMILGEYLAFFEEYELCGKKRSICYVFRFFEGGFMQ